MPVNPVLEALKLVRSDIIFSKGYTTVKPSGKALKQFEVAAYSNSVPTLITNIRHLCGYDLINGVIIHYTPHFEQHGLIEKTLNILLDSYGGATRKNGDLVLVHTLQAMEVVAAVHAPEKEKDRLSFIEIIIAGLHDIIEDVEENENGMKDVKFRATGKSGNKIVLEDRHKILKFIRELYGHSYYGPEIAKRLVKLTRKPLPSGADKIVHYISYLANEVYTDLKCAQGKWGDGKSNEMSILNISDCLEKFIKKSKNIYKLVPQIIAWKKIAWVPAQILLYGLREIAEGTKYTGIDAELRAPSSRDILNFLNGFVVAGPRKYDFKTLNEIPESGAPVLTYFEGKKVMEMEIPFCNDIAVATRIISAGFGPIVEVKVAHKKTPYRLDYSMVFSIHTNQKENIRGCMAECVKKYDDLLSSGELLQIFKGFNRKRFAEAAAVKWRDRMDSPRLEQFNILRAAKTA